MRLLLLSLIIPLICASQSKPSKIKIQGFGNFILGMSINDFGTLLENLPKEDEFLFSQRRNVELLFSESSIMQHESSPDSRVRVFRVYDFPINDDIEVPAILLKFFNDTLFHIALTAGWNMKDYLSKQIGNTNTIIESINYKCGKPITTKQKTTPKTFFYKLTGTVSDRVIEVDRWQSWNTGSSLVLCRYHYSKNYYLSKEGTNIYPIEENLFYLHSTAHDNEIKLFETKYYNKKNSMSQKQAKNELKKRMERF
jgi:hypothetical protein